MQQVYGWMCAGGLGGASKNWRISNFAQDICPRVKLCPLFRFSQRPTSERGPTRRQCRQIEQLKPSDIFASRKLAERQPVPGAKPDQDERKAGRAVRHEGKELLAALTFAPGLIHRANVTPMQVETRYQARAALSPAQAITACGPSLDPTRNRTTSHNASCLQPVWRLHEELPRHQEPKNCFVAIQTRYEVTCRSGPQMVHRYPSEGSYHRSASGGRPKRFLVLSIYHHWDTARGIRECPSIRTAWGVAETRQVRLSWPFHLAGRRKAFR